MMMGIILSCTTLAVALTAVMGIVGFTVGNIIMVAAIVVVGLTFSMFHYLIIDRNAGIIESFAISRQITRGNKCLMFLCVLVVCITCMAGYFLTGRAAAAAGPVGEVLAAVLLGLVGAVLLGPYAAIAWVVMYLRMSGQSTTADARTGPAMA